MNTYRIFGIAICTGKKAELDKLEALAAGTHFLTAYGNKRGGPRKAKTPVYLGPMEALRRSNSEHRNPDGSPYIEGESGEGQEASHVSD